MMIVGYISGGIAILIIMCTVAYNIGYSTGYKQATDKIRVWFKEQHTTP